MPEIDYDALNRRIRESGADWVAGPTSHSRFDGADDRFVRGVSMTDAMIREALDEASVFDAELSNLSLALPAKLDWRSHQKRKWLAPIRDQGTCGTCVAFAVNACLETRLLYKENGALNKVLNLSEANLYFCGNAANTCLSGWNPGAAFQFAKNTGVCLEKHAPYALRLGLCGLVPPAVKATSVKSAASLIARKKALQSGPVVGLLRIFADFYHYKSGVYKPVSWDARGLHAVCVVGYDDARQCWIIRNSWGANWGMKGYAFIRYGACELDTSHPFHFSDVQRTP